MTDIKTNSTSKSKPFVSVIILNYNGKKFLKSCLDSVLADSYHPKEIILVDNASSDGSLAIAREYQDRVTLIENPANYGFPKGCNQGINVARGDIIVLLNVDTVVRKNWLEALVEPLRDDPTVGLTGSKLLFPDNGLIQFAGGVMEPNCLTHHEGYGAKDDGTFDKPKSVDYLTGASLAIRQDVLEKLGGLDERFPLYFEDLDLCYRARQAGYKVLYQPSSVVCHYETFGTEKFSPDYFYYFHRGRLRFALKHFGLKYFLTSFLPYEWNWRLRCDLNRQIIPLLCAYAGQLPKAPYFWFKGFFRRRFSPNPSA